MLKRHKLPKLSPEGIDNLNNPTSIQQIEFVVKNLFAKKTPVPDDFTADLYQIFKGISIINCIQTLPENWKERLLSTHSMILKPHNYNKCCRLISLMYLDAKILNRIWQIAIKNTCKKFNE